MKARTYDFSLYSTRAERKYINRDERRRILAAMETLDTERALFGLVLAWTGARVSEVLALTRASFQVDSGIVTIVTLKRRKFCAREVPIPPALMQRLDRCFSIRHPPPGVLTQRLWPWCRVTAWRLVKKVMAKAFVSGRCACPRGIRHGFGVGTLHRGIPAHLIQRWMGHARLSTTTIYMSVCGPEEIDLIKRFWSAGMCGSMCGRYRNMVRSGLQLVSNYSSRPLASHRKCYRPARTAE